MASLSFSLLDGLETLKFLSKEIFWSLFKSGKYHLTKTGQVCRYLRYNDLKVLIEIKSNI